MALDTRGLASGFVQGFGLMDNYQRGQKQDERADRALDMREEAFDMKKETAERDQNKETAKFVFGKIANNMELADEEMQWLKDNPNYLAALNPETDKALEVAQRIIDPNDPLSVNDDEGLYALNTMFEPMINRGKGGQKRIAAGLPGRTQGTMAFELDVDGEDGKPYRAPMTKNRGVAGEDDAVLEVPVEDLVNTAQGYRVLRNAINTSGATENATKLYNLLTGKTPETSEAYQKAQELQGLGLSPEQARNQAYGIKPEGSDQYGEPFQHEQLGWVQRGPDGKLVQLDTGGGEANWRRLNNGDLYNQRTGEVRAGVGSKGGSSGQAPADVQTAEWMVANGIAGDLSEAYELVSTSKTNPSSFISRYVSAAQRNQQDMYAEDRKSLRELTEEARQVYQEVVAPRVGQPEPEPQPIPESAYAEPAPDGSMQGRVYRDGQPTAEQAQRQPQPQSQQQAYAQSRQLAPPQAVEHLRNNPQLAEQFRAKYGYLPEGF